MERELSGLKLLKESYVLNFFKKEWKQKVKIITAPKEQKCILEACMSLQCYFRAFWHHQDI